MMFLSRQHHALTTLRTSMAHTPLQPPARSLPLSLHFQADMSFQHHATAAQCHSHFYCCHARLPLEASTLTASTT
eukprot:786048-Amphidinium_carterae.1